MNCFECYIVKQMLGEGEKGEVATAPSTNIQNTLQFNTSTN